MKIIRPNKIWEMEIKSLKKCEHIPLYLIRNKDNKILNSSHVLKMIDYKKIFRRHIVQNIYSNNSSGLFFKLISDGEGTLIKIPNEKKNGKIVEGKPIILPNRRLIGIIGEKTCLKAGGAKIYLNKRNYTENPIEPLAFDAYLHSLKPEIEIGALLYSMSYIKNKINFSLEGKIIGINN